MGYDLTLNLTWTEIDLTDWAVSSLWRFVATWSIDGSMDRQIQLLLVHQPCYPSYVVL